MFVDGREGGVMFVVVAVVVVEGMGGRDLGWFLCRKPRVGTVRRSVGG